MSKVDEIFSQCNDAKHNIESCQHNLRVHKDYLKERSMAFVRQARKDGMDRLQIHQCLSTLTHLMDDMHRSALYTELLRED